MTPRTQRKPESGADFFRPITQRVTNGDSTVPQFDLADRMRKTLRESGVSVQEMADYLEVSRNTVGGWINGKTRPSAASLKLWSMKVGIPYLWIRDGESPHQDGPDGGSREGVRPEGFEPPTF